MRPAGDDNENREYIFGERRAAEVVALPEPVSEPVRHHAQPARLSADAPDYFGLQVSPPER
jgi:hypothetical protein